MTAYKFVWPLFLLGFATAACEEKQAPAPEAASAPEAAKAAEPAPAAAPAANQAPEGAAVPPAAKEVAVVGPAEVCGALIEAAKGNDEAKILTLSTPATGTAFAAEGAKEHIIKTFAGASCGEAKIEGDSASIALANTVPAQEASFSKSAEAGWKFDGAAFLAKYPVKAVKEKAKKAAAKTHGKAAAKKHHHSK